MNDKYLFKSERLGFRNWKKDDITEFAKINADAEVMQYFPKTLSLQETADFIVRLQKQYERNGYTYFATEILHTNELIGFIGLAYQEYETEFTPATDIGWRLKKNAWGKGYATEGANSCLMFAFNDLKLEKVISTCTIGNSKSENVMRRIGMNKRGEFKHPKLSDFPTLEHCIWYEISKI